MWWGRYELKSDLMNTETDVTTEDSKKTGGDLEGAELDRVEEGGDSIEEPLLRQIVHSLIAAPEDGAEIQGRGDESVEIVGVAWAGEDEIDRVEVSVDGGASWAEAELFGPDAGPTAWRQFGCSWSPSEGEYTLVSRATDARGRTQPVRISGSDRRRMSIEDDAFPANRRGYGNNAYRT